MSDVLISMGINLVLSAIKEAVKNPKKAENLKKALLKVRDSINILYPDSL